MGNELHKAAEMGFTVDTCLAVAIHSEWKGLKAEWVQNKERGAGYPMPAPQKAHTGPLAAKYKQKQGEQEGDFLARHTDRSWGE